MRILASRAVPPAPARTRTVRSRLRFLIPLAAGLPLALGGLPAAPVPAAAATSGGFVFDGGHAPGDVRPVAALAVVRLGNGDELTFTPVTDDHGRTDGVAVSGVRSPGRRAIADVPGLAGANPLELFVALARPGVVVPPVLHQLYAPASHPGQQGWARDLVLRAGSPALSCPAADWQHQLGLYGAAFHDDPFTSTWDGPSTKPQHWGPAPAAPADGHQYKDLVGQVEDVTAFYGSVLYCVEDVENASTYGGAYVGNYVSSSYRVAGTGTWHSGLSEQLTHVGALFEHVYAPGAPFSPSAAAYDFRITIHLAKPADQFHIGATWVEGRPSDLVAAG